MYEDFSKVVEIKSSESDRIDSLLKKHWKILNSFQYSDGKVSYGVVLMGLPKVTPANPFGLND